MSGVYSGDANFATSTSGDHHGDVTNAATTTTLTGLSTYVTGQTITVTATVSATGPGSGTPERHRCHL